MVPGTLVADDVAGVLSSVLADTPGSVYLHTPDATVLEALVSTLDSEDEGTVRVLAADGVPKAVFEDFLVASAAADLVAADRLALATVTEPPPHSLVVGDGRLISLVDVDGTVGGLETDEDRLTSAALADLEATWETARPHDLRTPPLARVRETLAEDLGPATAEDFEAVLDALPAARGDGQGLDEVTVSLLAAARQGELLYDLSRWGEDVGLASKATFSRTKTTLEEEGVLDTEKVPIEVGRPRLRLTPGDPRLAEADPADLPDLVRSHRST
jgi:hypothetical protein